MTAYFYTYNAIFDAPVSCGAKIVYSYLCKYADKDGKSYPSHKAIAASAGVGVTTVKKALSELESAGLIAVQGQARPDRGRRANIYTVIKENNGGFFMTYTNVFTAALTAKARVVYLYFCRLASGRDQTYPAHKTTAKACGLSVAGTRAAIDELAAAGLIERQAQYRDNGGQRSNLYTIITEPEDIIGGDPAPTDGTGYNESGQGEQESAGTEKARIETVMSDTSLIETEYLIGFHTESVRDPENRYDRQPINSRAFQMADGRVAQIGSFGQFELAHPALFAKKLDFEPDIFQKPLFFLNNKAPPCGIRGIRSYYGIRDSRYKSPARAMTRLLELYI